MTPAGHASVGYLAGRTSQRFSVGGFVIGSLLPDADFLLLPFPFFNAFHRTASHSAFVFLGIGLVVWLVVKKNRTRVALCVIAGALLHALADACIDSNPTNGTGVALFWPFSDTKFSPVNLAANWPQTTGWDRPLEVIPLLWRLLIIEVPLYVVALAVWFLSSARRRIETGKTQTESR